MKNLVWPLILIVFLVSRLMWIKDPICYDESGWIQIAEEVTQRGKLLYVDFFDNKPPLVYPVYLLAAVLIKEPSEIAMRSFGLIYQGLCLGLLVWVFNKYLGRRAAVFVGLTEAVVGSSLLIDGQCWLMTEQMMKPLMILWFVCLFKVRGGKQYSWWLAMGIITAAMMWLKQTYVFMLVPVIFYAWWQGKTVKSILLVASGLVGVSVVIGGFFAATGMFSALKAGAWDFNVIYYINHPSSYGGTLEALAKRSFYLWPELAVLIWLGRQGWSDKRRRHISFMLAILVGIGLYSAWAGGERMYRHYLVLFVFPLVMYAGVGWTAIKVKQTRYWAGAVLVIVLVYSMALNVYQRGKFLTSGYQSFYQELDRVRQLASGFSPEDRVSLWGDAMQFYYPLGLPSDSKYFIATGVFTYPGLGKDLDAIKYSLISNPPKLIVTSKGEALTQDREIEEFLRSSYRIERVGDWEHYFLATTNKSLPNK